MLLPCSHGQVLQQNYWDNVAEYSSNWSFGKMLQTLQVTGYISNKLEILSRNGPEGVELPVEKKSANVATV